MFQFSLAGQVGQRFWGGVFLILSLETDQGTPPSAFGGLLWGRGGCSRSPNILGSQLPSDIEYESIVQKGTS